MLAVVKLVAVKENTTQSSKSKQSAETVEKRNQEGTLCLVYLNCVLSWASCFLSWCFALPFLFWRCNSDMHVWAWLRRIMLHNNVTHGLYPTVLCRSSPACSAIFRGHEVSCLLQTAEKSLWVSHSRWIWL